MTQIADLAEVEARLAFLFPEVTPEYLDELDFGEETFLELVRFDHPEWGDVTDPLPESGESSPTLHITMHAVAASQVLSDETTAWPTAKRLLALGYDRHDVLHMLADVASRLAYRAVRAGEATSADEFRLRFDALPGSWLAYDVAEVILDWLDEGTQFDDDVADRLHDLIGAALLDELALGRRSIDDLAERFGDQLDVDDDAAALAIEMYLRWFVDETAVSSTGYVALRTEMTDGLVLRHVLTDDEVAAGQLLDGTDFWNLVNAPSRQAPLRDGGAIETRYLDRLGGAEVDRPLRGGGVGVLAGPDGWLSSFSAGDEIALTHGPDGWVITRAEAPDTDRIELVRRALGQAMDIAAAEGNVPADIHELVEDAAVDLDGLGDVGTPLSVHAEALGWSVEVDMAAPAGFDWNELRETRRESGDAALAMRHGVQDPALVPELRRAADAFERGDAPPTTGAARSLARVLARPGAPGALVDLVRPVLEDDDDIVPRLGAWALAAADEVGSNDRIGLRRVALLCAHMANDADGIRALADDRGLAACDDVAMHRALLDIALDQGRLDWARRHHRQGDGSDDPLVQEVLGDTVAGYVAGRNDPCPCGSGKKFKRCHGGGGAGATTARDRHLALWVRLGRFATDSRLFHGHRILAAAGLTEGDWLVPQAPLIQPFLDTVAHHEGGVLDRYLTDRGAILAPEVAALTDSWVGAAVVVGELDEGEFVTDGESIPVLWHRPTATRAAIGRVVTTADGDIALTTAPVWGDPAEAAAAIADAHGADMLDFARALAPFWRTPG